MALRTLPIFPLNLVLFPGAPQLLHIFEPRYRQMLADCERGDRQFGLSFLESNQLGETLPPVGSVGCQADIRTVQPLPDGRSNILAVGTQRYVLRGYVPTDRLYLTGDIETFDDEDDGEVPHDFEQEIRRTFAEFVAAMSALQGREAVSLDLPRDARALSFRIAAELAVPAALKQRLLELRSVARRLHLLRDMLEQVSGEAAQRVAVRVGARRNGSGRSSTLRLGDA